ncbi:MAG: HD domain-containing protein [Clostridia bacterium]|nr:HD domain-containing protein [Clostridia bacterium]
MDIDRLKHSHSVAKKMQEIGSNMGLEKGELEDLFVLGLNHDVGYEFSKDGVDHNKIGGVILRKSGYKYWREVYYHGMLTNEYDSLYLKILNQADMQIDKYGNDVGYEKRLEDIKGRYGEDSIVYKRCVEMIENIEGQNCNKRESDEIDR